MTALTGPDPEASLSLNELWLLLGLMLPDATKAVHEVRASTDHVGDCWRYSEIVG